MVHRETVLVFPMLILTTVFLFLPFPELPVPVLELYGMESVLVF
jgi:hypothetical protein